MTQNDIHTDVACFSIASWSRVVSAQLVVDLLTCMLRRDSHPRHPHSQRGWSPQAAPLASVFLAKSSPSGCYHDVSTTRGRCARDVINSKVHILSTKSFTVPEHVLRCQCRRAFKYVTGNVHVYVLRMLLSSQISGCKCTQNQSMHDAMPRTQDS